MKQFHRDQRNMTWQWLSLLLVALLFVAACGGGEEALPATSVPAPAATAIPPTETPVLPTPSPSPTPDLTAGFVTFSDEGNRVSFRHPADWEVTFDEQGNGALVTFVASDVALLNDGDFSQPLGFLVGEARLVAFVGSDDPVFILDRWLESSGMEMEPVSELEEETDSDGIRRVWRAYVTTDEEGQTLLMTIMVVVNGGRYGVFVAGTSPTGQEMYGEAAAAALNTVEVTYLGADEPMLESTPLVTAVPLVQTTSEIVVDFTDPASVLQAVFDSARLGDYSQLAGLCDPLGESDDDTAMICEITAVHEHANDFIEYFGQGRITGEVSINGDRAELTFLFGPDGDQEETMIFILRDDRWYLLEF